MATNWAVETLAFYQDLSLDGFALTVRTPGGAGTFSSTTLKYTGGTSNVDVTTYGVIKNYSASEIDGTRIQQRDTKLIISSYGLTTELTTVNQILINNVVQNVVSITKFAPANEILGYELQIRNS